MTNVNGANTLLVCDTLENGVDFTRVQCPATSKNEAIHVNSAESGQRNDGYRKASAASLQVLHDNAKELLFVAESILRDPAGGLGRLEDSEAALAAADAMIPSDDTVSRRHYNELQEELKQEKLTYKRKTKAMFRKMRKSLWLV